MWYDIYCCLPHGIYEKENLKATLLEASESFHYSHVVLLIIAGLERESKRERKESKGCWIIRYEKAACINGKSEQQWMTKTRFYLQWECFIFARNSQVCDVPAVYMYTCIYHTEVHRLLALKTHLLGSLTSFLTCVRFFERRI